MPTETDQRPLRADARRNRERLLVEARRAFAAHGTDTSLEEIARRAGVGIGTLYRHFPHREALLSAVFADAVGELLERARVLLEAERPCAALVEWLRSLITHASEYQGLSGALMSASSGTGSELSRCSDPMRDAGAALLGRAQEAGWYARTSPSATCSS